MTGLAEDAQSNVWRMGCAGMFGDRAALREQRLVWLPAPDSALTVPPTLAVL